MASANKCASSTKFYPLLKTKQASMTAEEFNQYVKDRFIDSEAVINMMNGNAFRSSPLPVLEVEEIDSKTGAIIAPEVSVAELYSEDGTKLTQMLRGFKSNLIESSVYNRVTEDFVQANTLVDGHTNLNRNIFKYKKTLLNNLISYLKEDYAPLTDEDINDPELKTIFNDIIKSFETNVTESNTEKKSPEYQKAYDSYVILSRFEDLLKEHVPFIEIRPEYKKHTEFAVDKYIYKGPRVKLASGWGNTANEFTGADKHFSKMSEILLGYFPEVNGNTPIDNTSIGTAGFTNVMTKMVSAFYNEPTMRVNHPHAVQELYRGLDANIPMLIDIYLSELEKNTIMDQRNKSLLQNKLSAIKKYIYADNMDPIIKNMFTQMMYKSVPVTYAATQRNPQSGKIETNSLMERHNINQYYNISNIIQSRINHFKKNPDEFKTMLKDNNINIDMEKGLIEIGDFIISFVSNSTTKLHDSKLRYVFTPNGEMSPEQFENLVMSVMSFMLPPDLDIIAKQVYASTSAKWNSLNLFVPVLGAILIAVSDPKYNLRLSGIFDTSTYGNEIAELSKVLSVANGSDTYNVIKNAEGNNLPLYRLINLSSNHNAVRYHLQDMIIMNRGVKNVPIEHNLIYKNPNLIVGTQIRSDVSINKKIRSVKKLTPAELFRLEIFHGFYTNLISDKPLWLQPTCYSDKPTQTLIEYDISTPLLGGLNIKAILLDYLNGNGSLTKLYNQFHETRKDKINALYNNIKSDYEKAFGRTFKNIDEINKFIKDNKLPIYDSVDPVTNLSTKGIQSHFLDHGIDFYEEIHAYTDKKSKQVRINESIEADYNRYNSSSIDSYIKTLERKFAKDLIENPMFASKSEFVHLADKYPTWFDSHTNEFIPVKLYRNGQLVEYEDISDLNDIITDSSLSVEINPMLKAYMITDLLLSTEYEEMMSGSIYAHPNKNEQGDIGTSEYNESSSASRLLAKYKRNGIFSTTYHPLAQRLDIGVPSTINIAVVKDILGTVFNPLGEEKSDLETMDGSGFVHPVYSRLMNNSLIDASAGENKKTIFHGVDPLYNRSVQLKWAEFAVNNQSRRFNPLSDVKSEKIYEKMNSIPLNRTIDLNRYYQQHIDEIGHIYFQDWRTGQYYMITDINMNSDGSAVRSIQEVDENGNLVSEEILTDTFAINNLYNVDQLFGGAFTMLKDESLNTLVDSESNIDMLTNIVINDNLKNHIISYVVNKSAIKVGAGNVNSVERFSNDEAFDTLQLSTKFGGLLLDADHELDMSEVTEMSQMISSLEELGLTHDLSNEIYNDIGRVVSKSMQKFDDSLKSRDKEKVYRLLAKSLVSSFLDKDKDTLGLAQSFVVLANQSLQSAKLEYTLPFSANSINSAFISTVTSTLVKTGIKRKYAGIGGVLSPSHNIYQYFVLGGNKLVFKELLNLVLDKGITHDYDERGRVTRSAVDKAINDLVIDGQNNPFIELIEQNNIDLEDTIVYFNGNTGQTEVIKIDSYEKYERIKSDINPNSRFAIWTIKPKNLKASNTFFTINGKQYSIYDLDSVRASHFVSKIKDPNFNINQLTEPQRQILRSALRNENEYVNATQFNKDGTLKVLRNITQKQLNSLATSNTLNNNLRFGVEELNTVIAEDKKVAPAQLIMGKIHAKQLGLVKGDTINKILNTPNFFYRRLRDRYKTTNVDINSYDFVMYDGTGKEYYVKFVPNLANLDTSKLDTNVEFKEINGIYYYDGIEIADKNDKRFYKYTDDNGKVHDYIVITEMARINELNKSKLFDTYKLNYTESNKEYLIDFAFGDDIIDNKSIHLTTLYEGTVGTQSITFDPPGTKGKISVDENGIPLTYDQIIKHISASTLNSDEEYRFDQRLRILGDRRLESFKKQLLYIGARIPTQSMQSFMPMELVAFSDDETNYIMVAKQQTWLQGSDYKLNLRLN